VVKAKYVEAKQKTDTNGTIFVVVKDAEPCFVF
jgi:hypothetical protein